MNAKEELEHSAGAVVVTHLDGKVMVLLVEHKDNTYVFPKGHIEGSETEEEAAKREILEETGVVIESFQTLLGEVKRGNKIITMFLATVPYPTKYEQHEEVFKWFTIDNALSVLRYPEDKEFLIHHSQKLLAE